MEPKQRFHLIALARPCVAPAPVLTVFARLPPAWTHRLPLAPQSTAVAIDTINLGLAKKRRSGSDEKVPVFKDTTPFDVLHDLLPLVKEWMMDDDFCPTTNEDILHVREA